MKVGVFDSGLGGLTVVNAITKTFKGAQIFYIADTLEAPYGDKTKQQILEHSFEITQYLIDRHNIDALIVACNTATSAAIKELREHFPRIIVIGTEPGIKPALMQTKTGHVGVMATKATLKGDKYQLLVDSLSKEKNIILHEQACVGLVEQIEAGELESKKTFSMLQQWLLPMKEQAVDTIVLGCTHYPLVAKSIQKIMGEDIHLIQTGSAIAKRLYELSIQQGHHNDGVLKVIVYTTGEINLKIIDTILNSWEYGGQIMVKKGVC